MGIAGISKLVEKNDDVMPKVLRIINRFNLGGPTYNVAYLSKYMAPEYETLLIGGKNGKTEGSSGYIVKNLGLHPITIPEMQREINYRNDYIAYKKIKDIIQRFKPDIVHTHASKAGVLGRMAASRQNVPVIVHTYHGHVFHSYFGKAKSRFYKGIERSLAKKTSKIVAISDIQKHELAFDHKIASEDLFSVIPLGFDLERFQFNYCDKRQDFREHFHIEKDTIAIGIVGRLVDIKNHDLFLHAFAQAKAGTNKKIQAYIIGDGELKNKLSLLCKNLGLSISHAPGKEAGADVNFTSWIKNIDWAFAGLDIAALTSRNEGTPVSLIEAQAANTPIVSTNVGGIENVVLPGKTALLAENNNLIEFSDALLQLISDDNLRKTMETEGWSFVRDKFSYIRLVENMKDLYGQLLR
jgi:glycosyltransferase involved in cell wall biosynthesis